jgi:hypothetical protein
MLPWSARDTEQRLKETRCFAPPIVLDTGPPRKCSRSRSWTSLHSQFGTLSLYRKDDAAPFFDPAPGLFDPPGELGPRQPSGCPRRPARIAPGSCPAPDPAARSRIRADAPNSPSLRPVLPRNLPGFRAENAAFAAHGRGEPSVWPGRFDESPPNGDNREVTPHLGTWACGAAGSALPWHGRGHRFDPDQVHQLNQSLRSSSFPRLCRILVANSKTTPRTGFAD